MQTQTLLSKAAGSGSITQNENMASSGPNVSLVIAQNQSPGFINVASGANTAKFKQENTLTAVASTPAGPVNQTQSSTVGGIQAIVNQFSTSPSTIEATQNETSVRGRSGLRDPGLQHDRGLTAVHADASAVRAGEK